MKNLVIVIITVMLSSVYVVAQTGINTTTPLTTLHVDAADDNTATPTAGQLQNDVFVTEEGRMGVGVVDPKVKLDVRSGIDTGIIGIGNTNQTAAAAGAGAVRYSPASEILQYSDGVAWHDVSNTPPPKAIVLANKTTAQTVSANNNTQYITDWTVLQSNVGSNFNSGTGIFTAPRDGFYIVTFNVTFTSSVIVNNRRIETIIESNQAVNNNPAFINVNAYPAFQNPQNLNNRVSGSCSAIFNLQAGSTIRFRVWHDFSVSKMLVADGQFNSISIYEL